MFSVPPPDKYGTKPFLKWAWTQGCSPRTSSKIQKYLRPRWHFPNRGTSDPRKQNSKQLVKQLTIVQLFNYSWCEGKRKLHAFSQGRSAKGNTHSFNQNLNSICRVCFSWDDNSCCIAMINYTSTYACRTQWHNKDERLSSLEKYTSHFIWKGSKGLLKVLLWEGVGDRTEQQHIDPYSYGHNSVSFPFSWAVQPGAWGPSLYWNMFLIPGSSLQLIFSSTDWTSCASSYIIVRCPPSSCGRHKLHSFNPSTVKVISWPDAPVIYTGAFPILTAWPGSICYTVVPLHSNQSYNL